MRAKVVAKGDHYVPEVAATVRAVMECGVPESAPRRSTVSPARPSGQMRLRSGCAGGRGEGAGPRALVFLVFLVFLV